jgi:threonine/homoserine/homoserine lactone efflux protein
LIGPIVPSLATLLTFIPVVLAMQAIPGPDTMLVVSRGIGQGRRVALWTAVGAVSAGIVQLPLLAAGIAALIQSSAFAFLALRYAGAAFLIYLGLRLLLRRKLPDLAAAVSDKTSSARAFTEGMMANLMNPNVLMFMLAFLPQFVDPASGSVGQQMLVLGAIQKSTGLFVLGGTALVAGGLGDWLARRPRSMIWQARIAGGALVALGVGAALTGHMRTPR